MISTEELYQIYLKHPRIITDSRKIELGCIFLALKGDNFNGNQFATEAIEKGAAYSVVDESTPPENKQILKVRDSLCTLQELAKFHRKRLTIPVIGLTGSNGKTTSKELCYAVLSRKFNVYATKGNYNNHIGVPLSVLEITDSHEMAIIEMGANHQKEIELLATIAQPNFAFITNIGLAHLEGFGSPEGVFKGKKELFDYIRTTSGIAFVNRNDQKVSQAAEGVSTLFFGTEYDSVTGHATANQPFLSIKLQIENQSAIINTNLTGEYNLGNILNAAAIGHYFGLTIDEIKIGLENYSPDNNRSQVKNTEKNTLILDAYNANPDSMTAALYNLSKLHNEKKYFILGDMLELGEFSYTEHTKIVALAKELNLEGILIGQEFSNLENKYGYNCFANTDEAKTHLEKTKLTDNLILLKGSRGIKLENLIATL